MNASSPPRKVVTIIGRIVVGFLLFLILLTLGTYLFRNAILRISASTLLTPYGIHIDDVQGLQMGTSNITIQSARFHTVGAEEDSEFQNLTVTFNLKDLMKGRVKKIELASVKISPFNLQTPTERSPKPTPGSDIDLGELIATLQSIPVDSIIIERAEVAPLPAVFSLSMETNAREINADIVSGLTAITAQINWHDIEFVSSYFIPDNELTEHDFSGQALTGSLQIVDRQNLATRFDFSLSDAGERLLLDATGEVQVESLMPLMYRYELLADKGQNLAGALYFSASLEEVSAPASEQLLNAAITLRGDSFITGRIPTFPDDPDATFQWHATQPIALTGSYQPSSSALELSVSAQQMSASLHTQAGDRQATLDISELTLQCENSTHCSGHQKTSVRLPVLTVSEFEVQNAVLVTSADISYTNGELKVHLGQGSRLGADAVTGSPLSLHDANILVQENVTLVLSDSNQLTIASDGVELFLPALSTGSGSSQGAFRVSQLMITGPSTTSDLQGSLFLEVRNLSSDLLPFILRKPELNSTLTLTGQSIDVDGVLKAADREIFQFQGSHDLQNGTGKGNFTLPRQQFDDGQNSLSQLFFSFPYEADVIHGTLEGHAELQWQTDPTGAFEVTGPVHMETEELSGFFEDTALVNLTTQLDGRLSDSINFVSAPDLHLEIDSFDPGLPIENIKLDYSVNTQAQKAEIKNISATLFGGTIQSAGLNYDWQAAENLFDVDFSRIDLSKVLSMASYEGIKATGFVSGHVPVRIAGTNVSVRDGTLHVEPPGGSIRYQSGSTDSGNPALDLVNQALSNYQYSVMDTEVSYLPNGDLNLGVKLEGLNPDMNQGQRINLNLNVSDNIPALLASLQASRNITDALQRELENR